MTTEFPPVGLIDRDKTHLTAVDEEAARLADVLEDHPDTSDVTDASAAGDIVFAAAGSTWVLDFQHAPDGKVFQSTDAPAPADAPAADVLRDVVVPALLADPAPGRHRRRRHPHGPPGHRPPLHPGPHPRRLTPGGTPRAGADPANRPTYGSGPRHISCRGPEPSVSPSPPARTPPPPYQEEPVPYDHPIATSTLEELADRVRFDLQSAGLLQTPPPPWAAPATEGGPVVYVDHGQVNADWLCHTRLHDSWLDMVQAGRQKDDAVQRYEAVRLAMHTALGTILRGFGYQLDAPLFGYGYTIRPAARP
ncbi:hypothetical protein [Streptomyces californicus]|uniref:hypothetical protein n=1 Tax=Streptomyces californicus TaxID=67351 RepID=UPI0034110A38